MTHTLPAPDLHPHDGVCEVAARARGELEWPLTRLCRCKERRAQRSQHLPDVPVWWSWLHGPREETS